MGLKFGTTDALPPLARGGNRKNSEENAQIEAFLSDGKVHYVEDLEPNSKEYAAISQRIRTVANRMGVTVKIRQDKENSRLCFVSGNGEAIAPETETQPVKTTTKASK